ncbi:MAG: PAS domain S-box protein [Acidobacteria bacterium]|nr:PAS domain S-box protein [Acidobacteriota bacterium]
MNSDIVSVRVTRLTYISLAMSVFCLLIGILVLCGWAYQIEAPTNVLPGAATMKVNTALSIILLSLACIGLQPGILQRKWIPYGVLVCAGVVGILSLISLLEYLVHWNSGIDAFLVRLITRRDDPSQAIRMSSGSAVSLLLLSCAIILLKFGSGINKTVSQLLAVLASIVPLIALLGYLYDIQPIQQLTAIATLAIHSSLTMVLLCFGLLLAQSDQGPMKILISENLGGVMARRLLPFILLVPVFIGWLRSWEQQGGYFDNLLGAIMMVVAFMLSFVVILWITAHSLNRLDQARKQAEAKVSTNEARFAGIVESAMDAIISADETQSIVLFNHSAETMFEYSAQEVLGKPISILMPTRFHAIHDQHVHLFSQAGETTREMGDLGKIRGLRKSGVEFPIEASISQIEVQGRKLYTVIMRDITERNRTEAALRQSEEHFRVLFEGVGVGNVECEAGTGRYLMVNRKMEEITGYTADELTAMSFFQITHPDDVADNRQRYEIFIQEKSSNFAVEKRYIRKDGSPIWVNVTSTLLCDANGNPWRTIAVVQDISERKRMEATQQESERRFRELAESLPQFIWTCTHDGLCDYLSPQWITYTGIPAREQLGLGWLNQLHPDDQEPTLTHWNTASAQGTSYNTQFRIRSVDGTYRWFRTCAVPLFDEKNRIRKWFGSNTDIEDLKRAEQNIQQLNIELENRVIERTEELAKANRELEAFAYSVSHDLRAPLRAIDGFSRILLEDYGQELSAEATEYLTLVRHNTQQMGRLIDDLLNLSRINRQSLTKRLIAPYTIVQDVLSELEYERVNRTVEILIDELPECFADPALLKQVYVNLLANALKFTRNSKQAVIQVGYRPASPPESPVPVFFVKDNGAGFDMKYSHKLFHVFQRLHRAEDYEGTGVGLAIVHRIVQRHGGQIWAESELNQGTSFYFTLEGRGSEQ